MKQTSNTNQLAGISNSVNGNTPLVYSYQYDQLNRLVSMDAYNSNTTFSSLTPTDNFKERISYDPNGNIQSYLRNGNTATGNPLSMDNLTYSYTPGTNKLDHIHDAVPDANYPQDIDSQDSLNYTYDAIGNLTSDIKDSITNIDWTVYGKINSITKSNGTNINYAYDAAGNRISKQVSKSGKTKNTCYVRDATGNIMSVYTTSDSVNSGHLTQSEIDLYGSSLLGIFKPNTDMEALYTGQGNYFTFSRGMKEYFLFNQLHSPLAAVSDKKIGIASTSNPNVIDHYEADVISATLTYSFGMEQPGMTYNSGKAIYGFNGKRKDNDIEGEGVDYDYGARIYDARVGRWLSPDPLFRKYAESSPYVYALNGPIDAIDPGGEVVIFINGFFYNPSDAGSKSYWHGFDTKVMDRIGDHHAIYRDGSSGGIYNTLNVFGMHSNDPNLNPLSRIINGYKAGKTDAKDLIKNLKRDPNDPNKIIETVKIVSHSMGTAYARGYAMALQQYVSDYNKKHPTKPLEGFKIETEIDVAAFQGSMLPKIPGVNTFTMNGDADWVANGKGKKGKAMGAISPSSVVPNATVIPTKPGTGHSIDDYKNDEYINRIPKSNNNSDYAPVTPQLPNQRAVPDATNNIMPAHKDDSSTLQKQ